MTLTGLVGVLLPTFLGWTLGKCMLETRGFLLPWLIQLPRGLWAPTPPQSGFHHGASQRAKK